MLWNRAKRFELCGYEWYKFLNRIFHRFSARFTVSNSLSLSTIFVVCKWFLTIHYINSFQSLLMNISFSSFLRRSAFNIAKSSCILKASYYNHPHLHWFQLLSLHPYPWQFKTDRNSYRSQIIWQISKPLTSIIISNRIKSKPVKSQRSLLSYFIMTIPWSSTFFIRRNMRSSSQPKFYKPTHPPEYIMLITEKRQDIPVFITFFFLLKYQCK